MKGISIPVDLKFVNTNLKCFFIKTKSGVIIAISLNLISSSFFRRLTISNFINSSSFMIFGNSLKIRVESFSFFVKGIFVLLITGLKIKNSTMEVKHNSSPTS